MTFRASHPAPAPAADVFAWFASPGAFRRLTPGFSPLQPEREAADLRDGRAVLRPTMPAPFGAAVPGVLRKVPPAWVAQHDPTGYVEGESFVDRCVSAPYAQLTGWVHRHHVYSDAPADGAEGSVVEDVVSARVPRRVLRQLFAFRQHRLVEDLRARTRLRAVGGNEPKVVAVSGASGLVGTQLCALLTTNGHRVIRLVRGEASGSDERSWSPENPEADLLEGVDVLVHLAGASIAGRFTGRHMDAIYSSRVGPTRKLAELVAAAEGETAMVCASAVGFYGHDRADEVLDEDAEPGVGFLAKVVSDWEADCEPARQAGARVVSIRTGIVLSGAGGVLGALAPLFRTGLGGRIGSGEQMMSWIALDDLLDVYARAIVDESLEGPVNAVAPGAVDNSDFTAELGEAVRRPTLVPVPAFGPKLLLGRSGGEELALADQHVRPAALDAAGHVFRYPTLGPALAHELGGEQLMDAPPLSPTR